MGLLDHLNRIRTAFRKKSDAQPDGHQSLRKRYETEDDLFLLRRFREGTDTERTVCKDILEHRGYFLDDLS